MLGWVGGVVSEVIKKDSILQIIPPTNDCEMMKLTCHPTLRDNFMPCTLELTHLINLLLPWSF